MSYAPLARPTALAGLLLTLILPTLSAAAQQPADSLRAEALQDFHGTDMTGKDGPLAKAGLDLLILYHEYRAFQQRGGDTFAPSVAEGRITNGHVTIDAIARDEAKQLRADLKGLGVKDATAAGRVVSCRLPIDQIPALAKLESLRGVVLPQMETQEDVSPPTPSEMVPKTPDDTASASSDAGDTLSEEDSGGDDGVLAFLLGLFGVLLLTEL
jgi:hypothetical protein